LSLGACVRCLKVSMLAFKMNLRKGWYIYLSPP
jgi:hypothetical protein